jgi:hypothetical protein
MCFVCVCVCMGERVEWMGEINILVLINLSLSPSIFKVHGKKYIKISTEI